jgi:hypothetical protein
MGVKYDNGGLYVPPARVFGRIAVEISMDDGVRKRLPNFVVWSRHENGVLTTRHQLGGLEVQRKLFVPPESRMAAAKRVNYDSTSLLMATLLVMGLPQYRRAM